VFSPESFPRWSGCGGSAYFRGRAVKIDLASAREVHASVRGTEVYAVMLRAGRTTLGVYCTCPYFDSSGRCKHVWATLLAAEERGNLAASCTRTSAAESTERSRA